jgi:hypothetical protein
VQKDTSSLTIILLLVPTTTLGYVESVVSSMLEKSINAIRIRMVE